MNSAEIPTSRARVIAQFSALCTGTLLCYAGVYVVLSLQSSINISEGLGASALTATYVTSVFSGLFLSPLILQLAGPKICILMCETAYFVYILANYYPKPYILIPAAILNGFAEATMFPANMLFCFHFAREYTQWGPKDVNAYTKEFTGILFGSAYSSGLLGYSLNQVIFFGGIFGSGDVESSSIQNASSTSSQNVSSTSHRDLSVCGINDCQDPNVTETNMGNYRPASEFLMNLLLGVMAGLVALAFIIHIVVLGKYAPTSKSDRMEMKSASERATCDKMLSEESSETASHKSKVQKAFFKTVTMLKEVLNHLTNPRQLLVAPIVLYYGLVFGFWIMDFNRAIVSCMYGVEKIGFFGIISTISGGLVALSVGEVASRIGRNIPFLFIFLVDLGWYLFLLLWNPTEGSLWAVYVICVVVGFDDGIWTTLTNEMYGSYFPENEAIGFTIWNLFMTLGVAWQTGWNLSLCVDQKIYFLIGMLCLAMLCHRIAIFIYGDEPSKTNARKSNSEAQDASTAQI